MQWYLKVVKNYVGFQGRARRTEYWMFVLVNAIASIILSILDNMMDSSILGNLYSLAILLPSLAVAARRLHDTGRSAWWFLINLIPLIGLIVFIVFTCQDSQPGTNKWGTNPKDDGFIK